MCGIFGVISQHSVSSQVFHELGEYNIPRGNMGFGGLCWSSVSNHVFRFTTPFDAKQVDLCKANIVLGHIRAPTGGQSDSLANIHPFETERLLLAHNGLLINHTQFPHWRLDPSVLVDSQVIIGGISEVLQAEDNVPTAITKTVSELDGQQGCWLWDKNHQQLYLWRVMSSLYYTYRSGQLIFSSVQCPLAHQLLPEGTIFQANETAQYFSQVGKFDFYNPYKV
ncbi:MAG: hypothetical protein AAF629_23820 [Chloroflexota bacterium]